MKETLKIVFFILFAVAVAIGVFKYIGSLN